MTAVAEQTDWRTDQPLPGFGPLPSKPCVHCEVRVLRVPVMVRRRGRRTRVLHVLIEVAGRTDGHLVRVADRVFAPAVAPRGPLDPLRYRIHHPHCTG